MVSGVRRWWRPVALTLVVSLGCVLLGLWQLDRREGKLARIAQVTANYDTPPVALPLALPGAVLAPGAEYTPVAVTGTYAPQATLLVRNRPLGGVFGYLVLVPLRLDAASGGGALLVDRGWIPQGDDGSRPDAVPDPPSGPVSVVARLRPPEPGDDRGAPTGQVTRIDLTGSVSAALGDAGLRTGAYGQLVTEDPRPPVAPALPPRPQADEGPHLGYSLQWFVFAAGLWGFLAVHVRRTRRDEQAPPDPADPAAGADAERRRAARARRRRDEDAEDAALDAAEARATAGS